MKVWLKISMIVCFFTLFTVQTATLAEEFTKEHLAAARAAVKVSGGLSGFDNILPDLADEAKALFIRSNPAMTEAIENSTNNIALKLAAKRPELDNKILEIWAARFDIEELNQIEQFYSSPVGQKFYKITPEIAQLSLNEAKLWRDELSAELYSLIRDELLGQGFNP